MSKFEKNKKSKKPKRPSREAEILSAALLDPGALSRDLHRITSKHFTDPRNALVFEAISHLHKSGAAVDVLTVAARLRDRGLLEAAGGAAYLARIVDVPVRVVARPGLPPELQEKPTDSPALKRARAAFLSTLPEYARAGAERLITSEAHRKAFNEYVVPSPLEAAKAAFDSAQIECVKACLGYATPGTSFLAVSRRAIACQDAGLALVDAYAALLRARDAAPVKLTEKGEAAQIGPRGKNFPGSKRRGSR